MRRFHICFLVAQELCSGININVEDYIDAVKMFNVIHGDKEIIYVSAMAA